MDGERPDVVCVSVELMHALECVVIEDSNLHVVRSCQDPILSRHEFRRSDRKIANFERLSNLLQSRGDL